MTPVVLGSRYMSQVCDKGSRAGIMSLGERDLHLWLIPLAAGVDPRSLGDCFALLDAEERHRYARFVFDRHRLAYLISHAFLRRTLSRYVRVPAHAWHFAHNKYGRPEAVLPPGCPPLRFNLSHTEGLAACAVTLGRDVGVDVEDTQRRGHSLEIAQRFFSAAEIQGIDACPPGERSSRFFDLWTLKEAYMKACGMGLALGLENLTMRLDADRGIGIAFSPAVRDRPEDWQFLLFDHGQRYRMAAAVRRGAGPDLAWRVFLATDLARGEPEEIALERRFG